MGSRALTVRRVLTMFKRQIPPRWGPSYVPAIKAVKGEAPGTSRVTTVPSARLQRDVHSLGTPELTCIALALYNARVWELKEQHILMVEPSDHPLVGHRRSRGLQLPTTSGTAAIAERLGHLSSHPRVREGPSGPWIPVPWTGDVLLFLSDEQGPYCVDWDVKQRRGLHGRPGPTCDGRLPSRAEIRGAELRAAVYEEYMRELAIRTVRVATDEIPIGLAINLRRLVVSHAQLGDLPPQIHADLVGEFAKAIEAGDAPNTVTFAFNRFGVETSVANRVLEAAVFERRIRVDLYEPWSVDFPLAPERTDPLVQFAPWFTR